MAAVAPGSRRNRFKQRRKAVGFTQESLAAFLTVERSTVVRWEAGKSEPLAWLWPKLAVALEITLEHLTDLLAEGSANNSADTDGQVEDDVNRREMLKVLGVGTAALSGALDIYDHVSDVRWQTPQPVESPVEALADITVRYRGMEASTPSRQLINPVRGHLDFTRLRLDDKQAALNTVAVAHGMLDSGNPEKASLLAMQALDAGQKLGSERVIRHVMTLNNHMTDSRASEVQLLKTRLAEVYQRD